MIIVLLYINITMLKKLQIMKNFIFTFLIALFSLIYPVMADNFIPPPSVNDLETIKNFLNQNNAYLIYNKFAKYYHKQITEILIKEDLSNEDKANRIIYVVY